MKLDLNKIKALKELNLEDIKKLASNPKAMAGAGGGVLSLVLLGVWLWPSAKAPEPVKEAAPVVEDAAEQSAEAVEPDPEPQEREVRRAPQVSMVRVQYNGKEGQLSVAWQTPAKEVEIAQCQTSTLQSLRWGVQDAAKWCEAGQLVQFVDLTQRCLEQKGAVSVRRCTLDKLDKGSFYAFRVRSVQVGLKPSLWMHDNRPDTMAYEVAPRLEVLSTGAVTFGYANPHRIEGLKAYELQECSMPSDAAEGVKAKLLENLQQEALEDWCSGLGALQPSMSTVNLMDPSSCKEGAGQRSLSDGSHVCTRLGEPDTRYWYRLRVYLDSNPPGARSMWVTN